MTRLYHRIYALLFGYFWLPCPICGRYFGGHEIENTYTIPFIAKDGTNWATCPNPACSLDANKLNQTKHGTTIFRWTRSEE